MEIQVGDPNLLPWVRVLLLIRSINSTDWAPDHQARWRLVSMARGIGTFILFGAVALGGCASAIDGRPASPAFTPQAECARNGGWWRQSMNFCDYRVKVEVLPCSTVAPWTT
jgi:hypothetical protein